tara:strand:- start:139 stop:333 length:195 start_codon:yes stop_codon:yes gene_type:complete
MGKLDTIVDSVTNAGDTDDGFKVSEVLKGAKRLENETYEEYKLRRKAENGLVRDYLKGRLIPNK